MKVAIGAAIGIDGIPWGSILELLMLAPTTESCIPLKVELVRHMFMLELFSSNHQMEIQRLGHSLLLLW